MEVITLGSASPRRLELLKKICPQIVVKPGDIEEIIDDTLTPQENAIKLAEDKLIAIKEINPNDNWILTADTFISFENHILGKPQDKTDAKKMLTMLSGQTHKVMTGVALYSKKTDKIYSDVDITDVTFKNLDSCILNYYLGSGDWEDAAGAYKIQSLGEILIASINGSYSSVMGLPLSLIYGMFVTTKFINPVT